MRAGRRGRAVRNRLKASGQPRDAVSHKGLSAVLRAACERLRISVRTSRSHTAAHAMLVIALAAPPPCCRWRAMHPKSQRCDGAFRGQPVRSNTHKGANGSIGTHLDRVGAVARAKDGKTVLAHAALGNTPCGTWAAPHAHCHHNESPGSGWEACSCRLVALRWSPGDVRR